MEKEFEELQEQGEELRKEINEILIKEFSDIETKDLWFKINILIDNEIEQEGFCNQ